MKPAMRLLHFGVTASVLMAACSSGSRPFREVGRVVAEQGREGQAGVYRNSASASLFLQRVAARDSTLLAQISFDRDVVVLAVIPQACLGNVHAEYRLDKIENSTGQISVQYKMVTTPAPEGNACLGLLPEEVHFIRVSRAAVQGASSVRIYVDGRPVTG